MINIYFDTEFSSLSKDGKLISIGCISSRNDMFYAEINDLKYILDQKPYTLIDKNDTLITPFVHENVLPNLLFNQLYEIEINYTEKNILNENLHVTLCKDDFLRIHLLINKWLKEINPNNDTIRFYCDCGYYDMMHLIDLITYHKSSLELPKNISYIPIDLCTALHDANIDPDINREEFVIELTNHNYSLTGIMQSLDENTLENKLYPYTQLFDNAVKSYYDNIRNNKNLLGSIDDYIDGIKINSFSNNKHNALYDAIIISSAFCQLAFGKNI